jgi:type I restriction enzyme S subunit
MSIPSKQFRTYKRAESVVFRKTKETFGGLSNMAGGFPLEVNGEFIRSSEALYQACRFPHMPEVQQQIVEQKSPMTAKMKSKPYRQESRPDWISVRVKIMRWCLRVKLAQNWESFSGLLIETGNKPIVEESHKDSFWGAKPCNHDLLQGMNVLGRLLMELRDEIKRQKWEKLPDIPSPEIDDFLLFRKKICFVSAKKAEMPISDNTDPDQRSLFDMSPLDDSVQVVALPLVDENGPRSNQENKSKN